VRRLAFGFVLIAALLGSGRATLAGDRLSGVVLMAPAAGTVVVHHAPFGGMPAMTMTYRVPTQVQLHPGDRISADVDRSSEPWSLEHIRVLGSETAAHRAAEPAFLKPGDIIPSQTFIDQRGRAVTLQSLRGKPYALTFVYTRCADPTMCPLISAKFRSIQHRIAEPADLVEISLDPAYDRPPTLARYAASFGADETRWRLLTGDPRQVLDFAARFGILEHSAGPVTIVHSERLAIVDARGRIVKLFDNAGWSPSDVLSALQTASAAGARTDRPIPKGR
jgi:protein SCO1/2